MMKEYHVSISVCEVDSIDRASIRKGCVYQCRLKSVYDYVCSCVRVSEWLSGRDGCMYVSMCMNVRECMADCLDGVMHVYV